MNQSLLIVGGDGLIGRALAEHGRQRGEHVVSTVLAGPVVPGSSIHFDLTRDPWPVLPGCDAAVVCAAIASQEQCRRDPAATRDLNVFRTLRLIRQLCEAGFFVVFPSTNLVFDGSRQNRLADEPLSPQIEYGRQKAEVERALAQWPGQVAIVRLTKVVHSRWALLRNWLKDLSAGCPVNAFSDYRCSPISLSTVVAGINRVAVERRAGVWQFSGAADVSYAELAQQVARLSGAESSLVNATPTPLGLMEHLPWHTTLDARRACSELQLVFPEAEKVLNQCLKSISVGQAVDHV